MTWLTLTMAVLIACAHIFTKSMRFIRTNPRSWVLSAAGGISVAYVFIHIMPELERNQKVLNQGLPKILNYFEYHIYLIAMIGLVLFYSLEWLVKTKAQSDGAFWVHMGSFFFYNLLIGYLLQDRMDDGISNVLLFTVAMTLHFMVNDHSLRSSHKESYDRKGRWILAVAVLCGWALGLVRHVDKSVTASIFAFLAGGILLNVLKEELPKEQNSRISPFLLGVACFSILLLALASLD
ncbi:hypothetical protein [Paenibacillus wynnii]|nr:hypothetical protein [Paenibacillus wynnii]